MRYYVEWKQWHYDTPIWRRVKKSFATLRDAITERKTLGTLTTRITNAPSVKQ